MRPSIFVNQDRETKEGSTDRLADSDGGWHICEEILLSLTKEDSPIYNTANPEVIMLCEISQTQREKSNYMWNISSQTKIQGRKFTVGS